MSLIGELPKFDSNTDDWQVYTERIEQFFDVNEIPDEKKKSLLLTSINEDVYKILRDLCHPDLPKDKTYTEIRNFLNKQFLVNRELCRERNVFYKLRQEMNESIDVWYMRIKKLSVNCKFGQDIEHILLDRFISGLYLSPILDRLCEEDDTLTLQQAIGIATKKENSMKPPGFPPVVTTQPYSINNNNNIRNDSYVPVPMDLVAPSHQLAARPKRTYRKRKNASDMFGDSNAKQTHLN